MRSISESEYSALSSNNGKLKCAPYTRTSHGECRILGTSFQDAERFLCRLIPVEAPCDTLTSLRELIRKRWIIEDLFHSLEQLFGVERVNEHCPAPALSVSFQKYAWLHLATPLHAVLSNNTPLRRTSFRRSR